MARAIKDKCQIIGVPKTIDIDCNGTLHTAVTFGFHSASQHYADLVQALNVDACATKKYIHLVKLMGQVLPMLHWKLPIRLNRMVAYWQRVQDLGWGL